MDDREMTAREFVLAVDALARMHGNWVSVKDALPELNKWVLVTGKTDQGNWWLWPGVGCWTGKHWEQDAGLILDGLEGFEALPDDPFIQPYEGVTHWM
ncbi:MAG: DUF551 domain-containing protein, partial [Alphaproteobacteria bacterium]